MTVTVDIKQLLEAGSHFGHKTSRWHPKMAPYIHSQRQGAHIINLEQTVAALNSALPRLTALTKSGKKILFVGTKKQMKDIVKAAAESVEMPYVTARWIGGTLTNVETINKQIKKLHNLERRMASGELETRYSKLEVQRFQEQIDELNQRYGGIKALTERPAALIVVDAIQDKNAIKEARTLGIPVFAITDTNVDPTTITHPIPANDDAVKSTELLLGYFTAAIREGKVDAGKPNASEGKPAAGEDKSSADKPAATKSTANQSSKQ